MKNALLSIRFWSRDFLSLNVERSGNQGRVGGGVSFSTAVRVKWIEMFKWLSSTAGADLLKLFQRNLERTGMMEEGE